MKITMTIESDHSIHSIEINRDVLATVISCADSDPRNSKFFSNLINHPSSSVRSAIARLSYMDTVSLEKLARDSSIEVVRSVAANDRALESFDASLLMEMIGRDVSVAEDIADNLFCLSVNARDVVIPVLAQHSDPRIADAALNYEKLKDELWEGEDEDLVEDDDPIEVD